MLQEGKNIPEDVRVDDRNNLEIMNLEMGLNAPYPWDGRTRRGGKVCASEWMIHTPPALRNKNVFQCGMKMIQCY
jgi:hypothetical protein